MERVRKNERLTPVSLRLGFLASHNGTDMRAIIEAIEHKNIKATAEVIISNNSNSPALKFAKQHHIPRFHVSGINSDNPDEAIKDILLSHNVNLVILSGWMKFLGPQILSAFPQRVLNVHPAYTKKFGGEGMYGDRVHEAVIKSGDEYTYPTIHLVDNGKDTGKVLAQGKVKIETDDTAETLRQRVQEEEKQLYIKVLQEISNGRIKLD